MIHALRYEPQGQRQRFEPREQRRGEQEEQDRHIHLHIHLNLTFRARQRRSTQSNTASTASILRIFAALVGATVMAFSLSGPASSSVPATLINNLSWIGMIAGLLIAWAVAFMGGLPLLIETWRSAPRMRFLVAAPLVLLGSVLLFPFLHSFGIISWLGLRPILVALLTSPFLNSIGFFSLLLYGYAFISTLMLSRAIRQATIRDIYLRFARRASFVVVGAMALMLLGALLLSFYLMLVDPVAVRLPFLVVMCIAFIVAVHTLFSQLRSRNREKVRPKDASPSDFDASQYPRGYKG